ncbi:MAG: short chain dehydrogenase [Sulfitobacter sp.]
MRVVVVGASGDIGQAVCCALAGRHEVIRAGRRGADVKVDLSDTRSVQAMFEQIGAVDAVVSTAGEVHFAPLEEQTSETILHGLQHKVMGQVNLVLAGMHVIAQGGSFTLTSGVLDRDPIPMGTGAATANAALAGFVRGAAIELPRRLRVNLVSPGLLDVSVPRYGAWFAGHEPVAAARVGQAYVKSVEGGLTGQVIVVA